MNRIKRRLVFAVVTSLVMLPAGVSVLADWLTMSKWLPVKVVPVMLTLATKPGS